jgi:prevent-host-death family protein
VGEQPPETTHGGHRGLRRTHGGGHRGSRRRSRCPKAVTCYMCSMEAERVGVHELRRNLSKYIRQVERGERLEVTEHGRPVAVLVPLGEPQGPLARLVAAGRVAPPRRDLLDLVPPRAVRRREMSKALLDDRAERL